MKMTIEIPKRVLEETLRHTGARTRMEAILTALRQFNRRKRLRPWRSDCMARCQIS